ncbi:transcriptional regulator [Vibrio sp. TRT 17S01]|uniref:transcriptional regulator n=1 Tax=Vibrio sp. TRT 17S01 TaxID=3418505 RepID=UPI003CE85CF0
MQLDAWVEQISHWYQNRKHDQDETLRSLLLTPPDTIWGPSITDLQSKAIACWLDGCLRVFHHNQYQNPETAYQYLQLAYAKLQAIVCNPLSELALKDWCMKRMQHLTVLALEFCNQQETSHWHQESHQLIESHVNFMATQSWNEPRNHDQGHHSLQ